MLHITEQLHTVLSPLESARYKTLLLSNTGLFLKLTKLPVLYNDKFYDTAIKTFVPTSVLTETDNF